jgi:threonine-phosphate decarboxylase
MSAMAQHGGEALLISKEMAIPLTALKDFSLNANPYGPPKAVISAINAHLNLIRFYPDRSYAGLKEAIASSIHAPPANVIVGNGCTEIIHAFMSRFIRKGSLLLCLPTFSEYAAAAEALGISVCLVEPKGVRVDIGALKDEAMAKRASCIILCNPNNPTGELIPRQKVKEIIELARRERLCLMVDEAYMDFADAGSDASVVDLAPSSDCLVVLRSLTKPYGFPGLRVGYAVCGSAIASRFDKTAVSWRVGTLEDCAGIAALNDRAFLTSSKRKMAQEKRYLMDGISEIGCLKVLESKSNFLFIDLTESGFSPKNLKWRLLSHGVLIRELSDVKGISHNFIRICVRDRTDNHLMLDSLRNIITPNISSMGKRGCPYYPCHFPDQACSFCKCPFYPCLDNLTGGFFARRATSGIIWSCKGCEWIHRKEVAGFVEGALSEAGLDILRATPDELLGVRKRAMKACPP